MSKKRTKHIEAYSTHKGTQVLVIDHDQNLWLWLSVEEYGGVNDIAEMMASQGHGVPLTKTCKPKVPYSAIRICL